MGDWQVADDIGARLSELREMLGETQGVFAERFGRRKNQVGLWERGEHAPPRSVLERAAAQNHWPLILFQRGAPRPSEIYFPSEGPRTVREVGPGYGGLQAAVNAALTDVVRWTAEGLTLEEAATRAIQLITSVAQAARADAATTAGESAALVDALRRRIGDLGEGRGAAVPAPPGRAAGGGSA